MALHLGISIRHRISDIHLIDIIIKLKIKAHSVIAFRFMRIHLIDFHMVGRDVIFYVETALEPTLLVLFVGFETPEARFHAIVEKTVTFCKVHHVDTDHFSEALWVLHLKIKPLQITGAVSVIPDPNIILNH